MQNPVELLRSYEHLFPKSPILRQYQGSAKVVSDCKRPNKLFRLINGVSGGLLGNWQLTSHVFIAAAFSYMSSRYFSFQKYKGIKCIYKMGTDFILDIGPN